MGTAFASGVAESAPVAPLEPLEVSSCAPKRRGPKYRVLPGGSRPLQGLEFRTEPRVVPATRRRNPTALATCVGESQVADHRSFRPRSRQWAAEREGLARIAHFVPPNTNS